MKSKESKLRSCIVSRGDARMRSQLTALCWLVVAIGCAVGFEGARPWLLWQYWEKPLATFICLCAAFIVGSTLVVGTMIGLIARVARAPAGRCRAIALGVSVGLAVLCSVMDLIVELPPVQMVSIWFPMALFAPRIAQTLAVPGSGFWDEPE